MKNEKTLEYEYSGYFEGSQSCAFHTTQNK